HTHSHRDIHTYTHTHTETYTHIHSQSSSTPHTHTHTHIISLHTATPHDECLVSGERLARVITPRVGQRPQIPLQGGFPWDVLLSHPHKQYIHAMHTTLMHTQWPWF